MSLLENCFYIWWCFLMFCCQRIFVMVTFFGYMVNPLSSFLWTPIDESRTTLIWMACQTKWKELVWKFIGKKTWWWFNERVCSLFWTGVVFFWYPSIPVKQTIMFVVCVSARKTLVETGYRTSNPLSARHCLTVLCTQLFISGVGNFIYQEGNNKTVLMPDEGIFAISRAQKYSYHQKWQM